MNLESKKFFGLFLAGLQPIFEKSGKPDFRIRMNREGSENFLLVKTIYGLPLLLVANFDYVLPSRGFSTDLSQFY